MEGVLNLKSKFRSEKIKMKVKEVNRMQVEDIDSILEEITNLSEDSLRKIYAQEKKITGMKKLPHNSLIAAVLPVMESKYSGIGKIHPSYIEKVLTGLDYAKSHREYRTGRTMLEDIVSGQRLYFNDYY